MASVNEPRVIDGGYAWNNTIAGLSVYNSDGILVAHIAARYVPQDEEERNALVHRLAKALNLATFAEGS